MALFAFLDLSHSDHQQNLFAPMLKSRKDTTYQSITGYGVSIALIPVYVNMFPLWKRLYAILNQTMVHILPVAVTLVFLGCSFAYFQRRLKRNRTAPAYPFVVCGIIICLLALVLPDPKIPIKRIHVAEYLLLSGVVRYAMSQRLAGGRLLFFSALFAAILGVHDELLQGLHPLRTYGLRDMSVNALAATGGAIFWHGWGLFRTIPPPEESPGLAIDKLPGFLYLAWLVISIAALTVPLIWYRGILLPLWPALPLLATIAIFKRYRFEFPPTWHHGLKAVNFAAFSLILYLAIPRIATVYFN